MVRIRTSDRDRAAQNAGAAPRSTQGQLRADLVRAAFAEPTWYLARGFNIRIRADVVRAFVGNRALQSVLDIGCGDGSISLPLLPQTDRLTLLDLSDTMLALARSRIPSADAGRVTLIDGDFLGAALEPTGYDLIVCMGVLAHLDSPARAVERMVGLLRPGGSVIIQNSDAAHPVGWLFHTYWSLRNRARQTRYALNRVGDRELTSMFWRCGAALTASYRYNLPAPGMARFLGDSALRQINSLIHGDPAHNRLAWLGSERIYQFTRAGG